MLITDKLEPLGRKTAVAVGYFDGMHRGHLAVLQAALREAEAYSLAPALLTFDMAARRAEGKGGRDLFDPAFKQRTAEELGFAFYISAPFGAVCDMDERSFVEQVLGHGYLNAAAVVCGENFRFGKGRAGDAKSLARLCGPLGIRVISVPSVQLDGGAVSTTRIKRLVESGDIAAANRLLGRRYTVEGEVAMGNRLASGLGFPTANILLSQSLVQPRRGVYLSQTLLPDGERLRSITNIGVRPTLTEDETPVCETHLLDYWGDLYGQRLTVELVRFLRPEQRFGSAEELREAVLRDVESARTTVLAPHGD